MTVVRSLHNPQVAAAIARGAVVVLPTDTIYGLAADARQPSAVAALYELKAREHKPGTVIAANLEQLIELGLSASDLKQVSRLWPNPISIVLPAPKHLDYLDQEVGSLAVRIPDDPELQALLHKTGPLVTSSVNLPGQTPASDLAEAQAYFGKDIVLYVDGGDRRDQPASTVVRLEADGQLEVLRQGAVVIE